MSALEILSHHRKPLASMSDTELELELEIWSYELSCRNRWGDSTQVAEKVLLEIEDEIHSRRVAQLRSETIVSKPFVVDDPGVAPGTISVIGAAKARSEWVPSRAVLVGAFAVVLTLFIGVVAMAGQRVAELENRYASDIL